MGKVEASGHRRSQNATLAFAQGNGFAVSLGEGMRVSENDFFSFGRENHEAIEGQRSTEIIG